MTVRIARWFGMPPEIVESGKLLQMTHSDLLLFLFVYWKSDRCSSRQFEVKDADISQIAGISKRALRDARIHLIDLRLLLAERQPGAAYTYTLCDPRTGRAYPGDPKEKIGWTKKSTAQNQSASGGLLPIDRQSIQPTVDEEDFDTTFYFGASARSWVTADDTSIPARHDPSLYTPEW